ncbi:MAG: DUF3536 domain-containing protein [Chloroflexota bacterium]|nr:DUF3536 domain-containing protein [Chloroflexota bacterium]
MSRGRLAVHGHFYKPDRRDPFSGLLPRDPAAAPYPDWTSRITAECYAPNAEHVNFARIGWDLGPALATWLRRERADVHDAIVRQENGLNGLAIGYHHSILPLASARDRRTEIRWGIRDFQLRFGRRPSGLWLPETAVDLLTLRIAYEEGIRYTILAPWQAGVESVDTRRPYAVGLGGDRRMTVGFYNRPLSTAVSFEPDATVNADRFAREFVLPRLAGGPPPAVPLALVATDGELYGHHQRFRDLFLSRLTGWKYPGFDVTTLGQFLEEPVQQPGRLPTLTIREQTSWSCHHGLARWSAECPCARDGRWKQPLRAALDRLAAAIDTVCQQEARSLGVELWTARDRWADVASEYAAGESVVDSAMAEAADGSPARAGQLAAAGPQRLLLELLSAQASRLSMFASDAFFWEDPSRPETLQAFRFAAHAVRLVDRAAGVRLEPVFVDDLAAVRSPLTGADGTELYRLALATVDQTPPRA